ncbi:MAG: hypothetical protein NTV92_07855, partial [Candidatus Bipolaricaulota bacterium]|nr:hypothetical protein [Candidatus Bipolaricaulota bacterium]
MHRHIVGVALVLLGTWAAGVSLLGQTTVTGPAQMERCDEGTFTIAFTNPSPTQTACQIVFEHTPPSSEFVYMAGSGSMTVPGYGTISANPVLGSWSVDAVVGSAYELPPGGTVTVQYRLTTTCLAVSGTTTCLAVSGTVAAQVNYIDCTQPGTPLQASDSLSVEILPGAVTVTKTPATPAAGVGDLVTWTLGIHSTGLGSIKNVVVTDTLGPGFAYVLDPDPELSTLSDSVIGQTITWDSSDVPGLADMEKDTTINIQLTARITACSGLKNQLDARFGCATGQLCADTATNFGDCGSPTATSSVEFIERLPFLEFDAPTITIPYCAAASTVTIPIRNTGDGTAHDGTLCVGSLGSAVAIDPLSVVGATYSGGCFYLPDIPPPQPPNSTYTHSVTFNVGYSGNWCTSAPSGAPLFALDYKNECGVTHHASPHVGSVGASAAPSLSVSVTKTGAATAAFGSLVTYNIEARYQGPVSCGPEPGGLTTPITVTDDVPPGFVVPPPAGGGTWVPGDDGSTGGRITWTFSPAASPFSTSVTLLVPLDCDYCYTTQVNSVTARSTSCCGCLLEASDSVSTPITCEQLYTSSLSFSPSSVLERCGDVITFTDVHEFDDLEALNNVHFGDFTYYFINDPRPAYVQDSAKAYIDGSPAT